MKIRKLRVNVQVERLQNGGIFSNRLDHLYTFNNVNQIIDVFKPIKFSLGLSMAIIKAYDECGEVTFNLGKGNRTFNFEKV